MKWITGERGRKQNEYESKKMDKAHYFCFYGNTAFVHALGGRKCKGSPAGADNRHYTVLAGAAAGQAASSETALVSAEAGSFQAGDIYNALDSLKATTDDSDYQTYYRNNGLDIVKEVGKSTLEGKITDGIGDFCTVAGNKLIATGNNMIGTSNDLTLSVSNMQKSIDGLAAKAGTEGSKGAQRRLNKMLEKQAGKAEDAASLAAKGDFYVSAGRILSVVSIGLNAYGIYQEAQGLTDLQNEHSSLRALEGGLHVANMLCTWLHRAVGGSSAGSCISSCAGTGYGGYRSGSLYSWYNFYHSQQRGFCKPDEQYG